MNFSMDEFLTAIFGDAVAPERRLVLFTVPEKRPRFFEDIFVAETVAKKLSETQDVYFGLGLVTGTPEGRGKLESIGCIGALWADVDFASAAHPDKPLPKDEDDFNRLLDELPLPPSAVVDSGFGRHLYWLLQEPWTFAGTQERESAAHLAHAWHEVVCQAARRLGWSLENLGDLTRILRLPGTVNRKHPADVRDVHIVEAHPERRYVPDDFEGYLPEVLTTPVMSAVAISELNVDLSAEPPADKLQSALTESPLFRQTWERTRTDLSDQSASSYDLSLASIAVRRGWTDSEVAGLLVAWRRQHNECPTKATRADYLTRTLAKARAAVIEEDRPVDLSDFRLSPPVALSDVPTPEYPDPGPVPESLCRIPGFVSQVMDYSLATAPYPNVPLAFCGALALQALLAGRKVADESDNRTNIYLLALAYSAVGKDWGRKVNVAILHRIGLIESLGDKFASGEGVQDALFANPTLLFQTDEIDTLLQSINKSQDGRQENLLNTLLTMYSSANSVFPMRRKAGKPSPGVIDQPCLIIYGTAIPTHYYSALSERMLTNGFFARMLIVESARRSIGKEARKIDPPAAILDVAQWWADFNPGRGNLNNSFPRPQTVKATDEARRLLGESRRAGDHEYSLAELRGDAIGTTVWGRSQEQICKLALLYAVSASHTSPVIDAAAVLWAREFVLHQIKRMLFMAHGHVAENPFHAECLKLVKKLRDAPDKALPHSVLLKRMKLDTKTFHGLIQTLVQQGDIEMVSIKTAGRTGLQYRLLGNEDRFGKKA